MEDFLYQQTQTTAEAKIRVDFIRTLTAYLVHKPFPNQKDCCPVLRI